jgi:hypothetical protein
VPAELTAKPPAGPQPGPIDNQPLLDAAWPAEVGVLRKDISEGDDYQLVEERTAQLLSSWYGGGPSLPRSVVTIGVRKKTKVDLHPLRFRLLKCDPVTGAAIEDAAAVAAPGGDGLPHPPLTGRSEIRMLSAKDKLGDLQETLHNAAVDAAEKARSATDSHMEVSDAALLSQHIGFCACISFFRLDGLEAVAHRAS